MIGPRLGAHMSIAGGPSNALRRGHSIGCDAVQMFTRGPNRWQAPELTDQAVADFHHARDDTGLHAVVAHSSYLINLGSPDEVLWRRSIDALVDELERCRRLGVADYVLHPGAHMGAGVETGLARVARGLDEALNIAGDEITILLETTAGQGTGLGHRFEQLAGIIAKARTGEQLGVCLDTAHVWAAGYEFRDAESYATMWANFDAAIGLPRLRAIHLNDSRRERGSRVDRHQHIGQGSVGLEAFRLLMNDPRLRHVPMLLETPKGDDLNEDVANLALLRGLLDEPAPDGTIRSS
jgi:deoxyribonuclease-4